MKRMIAFIVTLAFSLSITFVASAQTSPAPTMPADVKYAPIQFAPGAEYAYLASDGSKPENYTLRVRLRQDAKVPPHTHPDTRMITVLSGEVFVGTGAKFDPDNGTLLPPGSFYVVPAGTIHWSWAKSGEVTYQESGTGPTATAPLKQ
jgi:quercetin dioxygenase-like cupin family protein